MIIIEYFYIETAVKKLFRTKGPHRTSYYLCSVVFIIVNIIIGILIMTMMMAIEYFYIAAAKKAFPHERSP